MKQTVGIMFFFIASAFLYPDETGFVKALNGINIRDSGSLSGKVLGKAQFGEQIRILARETRETTIAGKTGRWCAVEWNKIKGWAFDAHLSNRLSIEDKLKYRCFLDNIEYVSKHGNLEFLEETFRILDKLGDLYYVTYRCRYPQGQIADNNEYIVYRVREDGLSLVQAHGDWMFKDLALEDINGDGRTDIIAWEGGNIYPPHVVIYLGTDGAGFRQVQNAAFGPWDEKVDPFTGYEKFYYDRFHGRFEIVNTQLYLGERDRTHRYAHFDPVKEEIVLDE